jgi:hypothetical protein
MRMRPAVAGPVSGRGILLLPAAALLVHQLRYWLTYGSQASNQLAYQGHAYLGSLVPWVAMLAAGGLGCFVNRLAHARRFGDESGRIRPFLRLWATTGGGLLAIYSLQELLEAFLAQGHPGGIAGVFGRGGWWSVPAAAVVSLVVVSLLRVARTLVRLAVRTRSARRRRAVPDIVRPPTALLPAGGPPLAYAAAGRAPPFRVTR